MLPSQLLNSDPAVLLIHQSSPSVPTKLQTRAFAYRVRCSRDAGEMTRKLGRCRKPRQMATLLRLLFDFGHSLVSDTIT
jgi:hypothetical protein